MRVGISSSCFYPLETERSLRLVGEAGAKTAEVFFNAASELEPPLLNELCAIRDHFAMDIASVHPLLSFGEGYFLFSDYRRRFTDSLTSYQRLFDAAATLGAHWVVLHGARHMVIENAEYADRLGQLQQTAKRCGVEIAHENVVDYAGQTPAFMGYLRQQLGNDFRMVLDLKQAKRAGVDPFAFVEQLQDSIVHVHISDSTAQADCLPPGRGTFDFPRLFRALDRAGYAGKYIIELYRQNFSDASDLTEAKGFLAKLLDELKIKNL